MTPAGHTLGLASPEPDTQVGISLVSGLRFHDEVRTGYTGHELLLVHSYRCFGIRGHSHYEGFRGVRRRSERVRWNDGGPPIEICKHFDAFSGRSPSSDHRNAASRF